MNIIYGDRNSEKTSMLIITSAVMGIPIICPNQCSAATIQDKAITLGVNIPKPIVHRQGRFYIGSVLLDDANLYVEKALEEYFGANIAACTFFVDKNSVMESKHLEREGDNPCWTF